jgi:hypothetical protein
MAGEKGKIRQGKKAQVAIYLGNAVRMFKKASGRIVLSTSKQIVSLTKQGNVTNGKRLFDILNALYESEHK